MHMLESLNYPAVQEEDYSTQGKLEFIGENIFWLMIAMVWYRTLLFRKTSFLSYDISKIILWVIVILSDVSGILLERKKYRFAFNAAFNNIVGFGFYTAITYFDFFPHQIIIALMIASIISTAFFLLLLIAKKKETKIRNEVPRLKVAAIVLTMHKILACCLAVLIIMIGINTVGGSTLVEPSVPPATMENISEQTIENHLQELVVLGDGSWPTLDVREKMDVLQTVVNIERHYLGISNEVKVCVLDLEENTLGHYVDATQEITISTNSLINDSPWSLIDTICHEVYHCYQYRLIDVMNSADESCKNLQIFQTVRDYAKEFKNYKHGEDDIEGYLFQECEIDASTYAYFEVDKYYEWIMDYLYLPEEALNENNDWHCYIKPFS